MTDTIQSEQSSPSLQERLRDEYDRNAMTIFRTAKEAADEIDRLQRKLEESQSDSERLERELSIYKKEPWSKTIASLRAELAAKDKSIESLEQTLENALHGRREFIDKFRERPVLITTEQINEAWDVAMDPWDGRSSQGVEVLKPFGIVACERCKGTKKFLNEYIQCDCPNNGWVKEER